MFTGLVTDTGTVVSAVPKDAGRTLAIRCGYPMDDVAIGESIACDGVCLTVEAKSADAFTVTCGRETIERTTAGAWSVGRKLHLERALRVGDRLGGHLVQGHVDGVGAVRRSERAGESWVLWVDVPGDLAKFVAEKGSITVDGVSLTVNEVQAHAFRVNLIPHTVEVTHLGDLRAGDAVNLEVDVVARYVARLLDASSADGGGLTMKKLVDSGFFP